MVLLLEVSKSQQWLVVPDCSPLQPAAAAWSSARGVAMVGPLLVWGELMLWGRGEHFGTGVLPAGLRQLEALPFTGRSLLSFNDRAMAAANDLTTLSRPAVTT